MTNMHDLYFGVIYYIFCYKCIKMLMHKMSSNELHFFPISLTILLPPTFIKSIITNKIANRQQSWLLFIDSIPKSLQNTSRTFTTKSDPEIKGTRPCKNGYLFSKLNKASVAREFNSSECSQTLGTDKLVSLHPKKGRWY